MTKNKVPPRLSAVLFLMAFLTAEGSPDPQLSMEDVHFQVSYDVRGDAAERYLQNAERTLQAFQNVLRRLKVPLKSPRANLQIVLLDQWAGEALDLRNRLSAGPQIEGLYDEESNRTFLINVWKGRSLVRGNDSLDPVLQHGITSMEVPSISHSPGPVWCFSDATVAAMRAEWFDPLIEQRERVTANHEVTHQISFNVGPLVRNTMIPMWLKEGLACLFEVPMPCCDDGLVPVNDLRLADISTPAELPPIRELITQNRAWDGDPVGSAQRYAHAWALTHFLLHRRADGMGTYLRNMSQRKPNEVFSARQTMAEFEAAFGPVDESLEKEWRSYVTELIARTDPSRSGAPG